VSFGLSPDIDPLVFLDIHINKQRIERIAIYKGQNPDEAIHRFGLKHQLNAMDI
jgi:hypothetical protein